MSVRSDPAHGARRSGSLAGWSLGLVVVSVVFGGASRENPLQVMLVELAALPVLYLSLRALAGEMFWREIPAPLGLLALIVALPLVQIIPLPPALWQGLPGREAMSAALTAAGLTPGWMPLSMSPEDTHAALLALMAPAAMFLAVQTLDPDESRALMGAYLILAVIGLGLGAVQLSSGQASLGYLYRTTNHGSLVGLFANRNHEASYLLAMLPFAAVFVARRDRGGRSELFGTAGWFMILLVIAALGAVHSRAGLLLAAPALIGCVAVAWRAGGGRGRGRTLLVLGGMIAAGVAIVLTLALAPNLSRFSEDPGQETRLRSWPHVEQAAAAHLPFGAGIGAFDRVYRAAEPLELVTPTYLNHAHNDYLELWLEAGWPGAAILAAVLAWLAWMSARAWRRPAGGAADLQRAASVAVGVMVLHSLVDYPLRTLSMAVLFAFCCGMLCWPSAASRSQGLKRRSA